MPGKPSKLRELAETLHLKANKDNNTEFSAGTATIGADGKVQPPAAAAPEFSGGTLAQTSDQLDRSPDQGVASDRPEATIGKPADKPAEKERNAAGQFVGEAPAAEKPAKEAQAAGGQAAEAAADALLDPFADYEDVEYEDEDLGTKYTVKARKAEAKAVKDGYVRRSMWNRQINYARKASPVIEKLIANGQLEQILPLLQRALDDTEYGQFVVDGYNRRVSGKPLIEQAIAEAQAAGRQAAPQYDEALAGYNTDVDPFFGKVINDTISPLAKQLTEVRTEFQAFQQQQVAQAQQQARQAQIQAQRVAEFQGAHQDLHQRYPDEFTGNIEADNARMVPIAKYARESGYIDTYGLRSGMILAAGDLRAARADGNSPAAEMVAQIDQVAIKAAQQQAANARTVGSGNANAPRQAPPAPPQKVSTTHPNGKRKTADEFLRDAIAANPALQQAAG